MKDDPPGNHERFSGRMIRRKTKIVCTLGPASSSLQMIGRLIAAGMNCARLNFSHGEPDEHLAVIRKVRSLSESHREPIAIMQDLPGAKIRVGTLKGGSITLKRGASVRIVNSESSDEEDTIPIRQKHLVDFIPVGASVFLSDGLIRLRVISKNASGVVCRCQNGGKLLSGKGVNIPELAHGFKGFTEQDKNDLLFGLQHGVDLIAVSFVKGAADILHVKKIIESTKSRRSSPWIVAKIERREAVHNMSEIVSVSDAVMVARGDLGVENPVEKVPVIQKKLIAECNRMAVPVITATQMLESMVQNPRPTRAEASDASNAVLDGSDALMLSEETAIGAYPVECVRTLDRVARASENWISNMGDGIIGSTSRFFSVDALPSGAVSLSNEAKATSIICPTMTGKLARRISRERPGVPIVALASHPELSRKLSLVWGVIPLTFEESHENVWGTGRSTSIDILRQTVGKAMISSGLGKKGDKIVLARDTFEQSRKLGDLLVTTEIPGVTTT
jgi:pyruvate kinase